MLLATVLALVAAGMHAGWNLAVKQAGGDRYVQMWGQILLASPLSLALLVLFPPRAAVWPWALLSGATHIPYVWFLARGYEAGDYSIVYPIARGGGAALGAITGAVFLGDRLGPLGMLGIAVVCVGLVALPEQRRGAAVASALMVAVTIGLYSAADAKGVRTEGTWRYVNASALAGALGVSIGGIASGRTRALRAAVPSRWRTMLAVGLVSKLTYALVQIAMRHAPVGYVSALRESSVVIASVIGPRLLGERSGPRRLACSVVVVCGVVLLIFSR